MTGVGSPCRKTHGIVTLASNCENIFVIEFSMIGLIPLKNFE